MNQKNCYNWLTNVNPITGGARTLEPQLVAEGFFKCDPLVLLGC